MTESKPSAPVGSRVAAAAAFGCATAALAYAWVRGVESVLFPQADPRAVVAVVQGGYLVRCAVAAFVGGMGAFAGWALSASPERAARWLFAAVLTASVAVALQAGVAP